MVPVILVSRNRKVVGVRAFVLDWFQVCSGERHTSPRMPWTLHWSDISWDPWRWLMKTVVVKLPYINYVVYVFLAVGQWRFMTNCSTPVRGGLLSETWALTSLPEWWCFDCILPWL